MQQLYLQFNIEYMHMSFNTVLHQVAIHGHLRLKKWGVGGDPNIEI